MRTLLANLLLVVTLIAGCARTATQQPISLQVIDDLTTEPIDAILVVRTMDPRHPLSVADMLRPAASSRRTYLATHGHINGVFDATLEQAELVAGGYEPTLLTCDQLAVGSPQIIRLRRLQPPSQAPNP